MTERIIEADDAPRAASQKKLSSKFLEGRAPSGLQWKETAQAPAEGILLEVAALKAALVHKAAADVDAARAAAEEKGETFAPPKLGSAEFSREEWTKFYVKELLPKHYVQADGACFVPVMPPAVSTDDFAEGDELSSTTSTSASTCVAREGLSVARMVRRSAQPASLCAMMITDAVSAPAACISEAQYSGSLHPPGRLSAGMRGGRPWQLSPME